jgi:hypothetical protein
MPPCGAFDNNKAFGTVLADVYANIIQMRTFYITPKPKRRKIRRTAHRPPHPSAYPGLKKHFCSPFSDLDLNVTIIIIIIQYYNTSISNLDLRSKTGPFTAALYKDQIELNRPMKGVSFRFRRPEGEPHTTPNKNIIL